MCFQSIEKFPSDGTFTLAIVFLYVPCKRNALSICQYIEIVAGRASPLLFLCCGGGGGEKLFGTTFFGGEEEGGGEKSPVEGRWALSGVKLWLVAVVISS